MLIIDDLVMLGKTVPEPNSDGRIFVCSAGVSRTVRSLIRIYPLSIHRSPPRWTESVVRLERNPKDSRIESYKLAGDRDLQSHGRINDVFRINRTVPSGERFALVKDYVVGSIAEANDRRMSLAIIHADDVSLDFEYNPKSENSPQLQLFDTGDRESIGAKRFSYIPRLSFIDPDGRHHLMLRDWGVYEFMRKRGDEHRHELTGALHLNRECSLLVGNFNRHRNTWLVISVLHGIRPALSLFDVA